MFTSCLTAANPEQHPAPSGTPGDTRTAIDGKDSPSWGDIGSDAWRSGLSGLGQSGIELAGALGDARTLASAATDYVGNRLGFDRNSPDGDDRPAQPELLLRPPGEVPVQRHRADDLELFARSDDPQPTGVGHRQVARPPAGRRATRRSAHRSRLAANSSRAGLSGPGC